VGDPDPYTGIGNTIDGTLNSLNRPGSYARYFEFTLGVPTDVVIEHEGGGAGEITNPYLYLMNSSWNVITSNDDCGTLDSAIACSLGLPTRMSLGAGTYYIEATTFGTETGDFRLSLYQWTPPPTIPITVAAADPTFGVVDGTELSIHRSGRYATYYEFTLGGPQTVNIDLVGSIAAPTPIPDTYLFLLDSGYNTITFNDDCILRPLPGVWDSCLTSALGAGTYIVEVTTYSSSVTGDFELSLW
jgi:hypothetical protein